MANADRKVIEDFGHEWKAFDYTSIDDDVLLQNFNQYFSIFPWDKISDQSEGFDMGCGTGRWAKFIAPKVKRLNCIEPSDAIDVAKENLAPFDSVAYYRETTEECSLPQESQDFGYCLGVLHHIIDTQSGIKDCARLLKSGAPFLLYLYYNFENKPLWFKILWRLSDGLRKGISSCPLSLKKVICNIMACVVYFPLARSAKIAESFDISVENFPLTDYRHKPFYQMQNDALDRFGTRIEHRFSRQDIRDMLENAGFQDITFSDQTPYWCCVSYKK